MTLAQVFDPTKNIIASTKIQLVDFSDEAKYQVEQKLLAKGLKGVRFALTGGGCAGFSYKWDYLDSYDNSYTVLPIQDNVVLAIDKVAEMYIMGSEIDYTTELSGSFLKINNPLTKSSCGCGESFSV